jgi:hypothetical protein
VVVSIAVTHTKRAAQKTDKKADVFDAKRLFPLLGVPLRIKIKREALAFQ